MTGNDYNHNPVSLTDEEIDKLPTIILVISGYDKEKVGDESDADPNDVANYIGDVTDLSENPRDVVLAIPAAHYMEFDPDNGKYVPRFYTEESSGSVLGANAMMGHDVYFDIARGRIGFAESSCDYVSLLLSEGTSISVPPSNTVSTKTEVVPVGEEEDVAVAKEETFEVSAEEGRDSIETENPVEPVKMPGPDQSENKTPYELFGNNEPQGHSGKNAGFYGKAEQILDDMKHECSSSECRGIAGLFILGAAVIVIAGIRRALARRRVVRQYQEAELEISDLALDSDSDDDEGGYVDEPPMPRIT